MPDAKYLEAAELRSALRHFLRRSEEVARRNQLTPRQYLLLLMIKASDESRPATITDLVERLALTQSTITELVQRAEEAGLVARAPSTSDGRVTHLSLTPVGTQRFEAAFSELGPEREELLGMFRSSV